MGNWWSSQTLPRELASELKSKEFHSIRVWEDGEVRLWDGTLRVLVENNILYCFFGTLKRVRASLSNPEGREFRNFFNNNTHLSCSSYGNQARLSAFDENYDLSLHLWIASRGVMLGEISLRRRGSMSEFRPIWID